MVLSKTPFITSLLLALLLFPSSSHSQLVSRGLPFSPCRSDSNCQSPLRCLVPFKTSRCLQSTISCLCQPEEIEPDNCISSSDCPAPLVCAQTLPFQTLCVAPSATRTTSLFAPLPRLQRPPRNPRAFDQCQVNSDCAPDFTCIASPGNTSSCPSGSPSCVCDPPRTSVQDCFASDDCNGGEVCVNSVLNSLPMCVSRRAANRWIGFREIVYPDPPGLSLDPCNFSSDCVSPRECKAIPSFDLCDGRRACVCLRLEVDPCSRVADCGASGEVCATAAGLLDNAECISSGARDAFDFVQQVDSNDTCPVLINRDLPSTRPAVRALMGKSTRQIDNGNELNLTLTATEVTHEKTLGERSLMAMQMEQVRIVGGLRASGNLRPFMVFIVTIESTCSGVLIGRRWILSAAHCNIQQGDTVVVGASVLFMPLSASVRGSALRVVRTFEPPRFSFEQQNVFDIAVAELSGDAPEGAKFMRLNSRRGLPRLSTPVRALGYGRTSEDEMLGMSTLRQVDLKSIGTAECRESESMKSVPTRIRPGLHLCAEITREQCGICDGDSGGPLIIYQRNEPLLVGIASSSASCDTTQFPALFTRVSGFISFLESTPAEFRTEAEVGVDNSPPCAPGEFLLFPAQICSSCPIDQVSRGGRTMRCQPCPMGLRRDSDDGRECTCRGENAVGRGIIAGRCRRCPAGFFSGVNSTRCRRCRRGTTSRAGAESCV